MQALKVLNDDMQCDVIKIGGLVRNKVSTDTIPHVTILPLCQPQWHSNAGQKWAHFSGHSCACGHSCITSSIICTTDRIDCLMHRRSL